MIGARIGEVVMNDWGLERRPSLRRLGALNELELPSRLDTATPGWLRFAGRIRITLNGDDVTRRCIGFNVGRGTVTRQATDDAGRIFIDPVTQKVAVERLRGTVEVAWK